LNSTTQNAEAGYTAAIERVNSVLPNGGADQLKFLEGKIKRLENELASAFNDIKQKDQEISQFRRWHLQDRYMDGNEQAIEEFEKHKVKIDNIHE
jgi:hypothetical protein